MRTIKMDSRLYEQIMGVAADAGISPAMLVEEAVVYYLLETKEALIQRVQERLDTLFEKLETYPKFTVLPPPTQEER
jgi:selenocysteine lyase/cysteine desulfurase